MRSSPRHAASSRGRELLDRFCLHVQLYPCLCKYTERRSDDDDRDERRDNRDGRAATTMRLEGIHHVTCITGDAPGNVDFYTRVLGLRLVKKTVNQDDPTVYHLFYADEKGRPGADITFFEYPGARRGRAGDGMVHTVTFRVASDEALDFWAERLAAEESSTTPRREPAPLRGSRGPRPRARRLPRADEPLVARHPEIPAELALQGFDGVRAFASRPRRAASCSRACSASRHRGRTPGRCRGEREAVSTRTTSRPHRRRDPRRGDCPPRRLRVDDGRSRGVAAERRRGGHAADAGDRPLLVPLDLLPRAERCPVRDRDARARASAIDEDPGAPRRVADPAARIRAPARRRSSRCSRRCPTREPHGRLTASSDARGSLARARRRAGRRARPPPRPRGRRERPLPAARPAGPGQAPARRHSGRPSSPRAGRSPLVRARRDPDTGPADVPRHRPAARGVPRRAAGAGRAGRARRVLAGRGDELGDEPRARPAATRRHRRDVRLPAHGSTTGRSRPSGSQACRSRSRTGRSTR